MGRLRTRVERLERLPPAPGGSIPDQTGHGGEYLTTDGATPSWAAVPGGSGTVTSVGVTTGASGVVVTNSPITTSGDIDIALGTAAAAATTDFDAAGDAAAAEAAANAYTDAAIAALSFDKSPGCVFSNGNLTLTGTLTSEIRLPYGGTITAWSIVGDAAGDVSIAVSHATYAAYPTMTSLFTATCTGSEKADDTGLSHALAAGDVLRFSASGFALFTRCSIVLTVTP